MAWGSSFKGRFSPKFPKKYKGDPTNIIFRSGLEYKFMSYLDMTTSILEWSSEELCVNYIDPMTGKTRRYFPDFIVKCLTKDKQIQKFMVEIKPDKQTREPIKQSRKTNKYLNEVKTYAINNAKWEAAKRYCEKTNMKFLIITEKNLGGW